MSKNLKMKFKTKLEAKTKGTNFSLNKTNIVDNSGTIYEFTPTYFTKRNVK